MSKRGGSLRRWQKRYFVLYSSVVTWYAQKGDLTPAGECRLYKNSQIVKSIKLPSTMSIKPTPISKTYVISAIDDAEIEDWIKTLQQQAALQPNFSV